MKTACGNMHNIIGKHNKSYGNMMVTCEISV